MALKVGDVEIAVRRKAIKHMHLYVQPPDGRVLVSAPNDASDESVVFFVRENFGWVLKKRASMGEQRRQTRREYVSGETHYVWGEQRFLEVRKQDGWGGVTMSGNRLLMLAPRESTENSRRMYMQEWERSILSDAIRETLPKLEKKTGLQTDGWSIVNMRRSWGKCNPARRRIVLNLQLVRKPREALEYIILHELCHLKTRTHGKEFVANMNRYMPDWKDIRKRLNEMPLDYIAEDNGRKGTPEASVCSSKP